MPEEKKAQKKLQALIAQLQENEAKKQIAAIQELKIHGNPTAIEPLIALHVESANNAVKSEIEGLLNTLKSEDVQPAMIDCLNNPEFEEAQQIILASIWNSNLDYSNYLNDIVVAAINGDFMLAMECLTIFENMEADLTEEKVMPPLLSINQYLNDNHGEDSPKHNLLTEVGVFLNRVNQSL